MDNGVLKKRLNTFKTGSGQLRDVSDEVVIEVLRAWENWRGTAAELYRELGLSKMQLVNMIKKAKRLVKSGVVTESEFKEVQVSESLSSAILNGRGAIELVWGEGKLIRFFQVNQLIEFLKKVGVNDSVKS